MSFTAKLSKFANVKAFDESVAMVFKSLDRTLSPIPTANVRILPSLISAAVFPICTFVGVIPLASNTMTFWTFACATWVWISLCPFSNAKSYRQHPPLKYWRSRMRSANSPNVLFCWIWKILLRCARSLYGIILMPPTFVTLNLLDIPWISSFCFSKFSGDNTFIEVSTRNVTETGTGHCSGAT